MRKVCVVQNYSPYCGKTQNHLHRLEKYAIIKDIKTTGRKSMFRKIWALTKKYEDILVYLVFGVLTTLVNYAVYLPLYNAAHLSATASNVIAWAVSVAFAYLTNKPFVFRSHDWSARTVLPELMKFVGCRVGSGLLETGIIFVTVDCLAWNGNVWKLATSVLVVVINYVASKLLVFKKKG